MKFRRNKTDHPAEGTDDASEPTEAPSSPAGPVAGDAHRTEGPWDSSEVDLNDEGDDEGDDAGEGAGDAAVVNPARVDLGALLITGRPGLELRLQVDEASQQVAAVLLVGREGAVELRPFAAPRNGDIWADVRKSIAAETARRGGTATEAEGPFGPELRVSMPVTTPDGQSGTQPSRVLGINGPRWLLRATLLGRPAVEPDHDGLVESALRDVIVVRGNAPMAPGDPLPLVMPGNAQMVAPE